MVICMDELKMKVAKKALEFLESNIILGIGSGSTVRYFIKFLGEAIRKGELSNIIAIPTGIDTELLLIEEGIPISTLNQYPELDLAVDGADSVLLENKVLIKGGGGAFFREKIVDYRAKKLVIIVDESKINREFPVPVEVIPISLRASILDLKRLGGLPQIRFSKTKLGPTISDNGNIILDVKFPMKRITADLEVKINSIPGVLENGIFSRNAKILIGMRDETKEIDFL